MLDFDFSVEHVLMFMIAIFLLYHLIGRCGYMKDGFCFAQSCDQGHCQPCSGLNPFGKRCGPNLTCRSINNGSWCGRKDGMYCLPS